MRIPLRRSRHWCPSATSRVAEVAVPMQEYLAAARSMGITIVWAPSDVTDFYNTTAARNNTLRLPKRTRAPGQPNANLAAETLRAETLRWGQSGSSTCW